MAKLALMDSEPGDGGSGLAHAQHPNQKDPTAPSLVEVWLSQSARFPRREQHVPELEPITISDWEEEAVVVIAHEFQHVQQFYGPQPLKDDHWREVDAEAFAIETLNAWRSRQAPMRRAA